MSKWWGTIAFGIVLLVASASGADAQSAIAGVVKDTSGGALPGVTVEAASASLIEKTRSVVSDEHGEYKIVNLPPGTYTVTFTLSGFSVARREALELPSAFTATVNMEMKIGALEETVTVSGASPVVDVRNTTKEVVLDRELLDVLPTAHTAQSVGQLIPGIALSVPDVGGSTALQQAYFAVHGLGASQTIVLLDGLQLSGMCSDGIVQPYMNNQNFEQEVFQTNGAGADVSSGGVHESLVPKRGGNQAHGSFAVNGSSGSWQANNLTADLIQRGLTAGNRLSSSFLAEGGLGGKIIRDKLWFFGAAKRVNVNNFIASTFYPDGSQGIDDQHATSAQLRLTLQASPKNQLTAYSDRVFKFRGHAMNPGDDPLTSSQVWPNSPLYEQSEVKWTTTMSSKLLLTAGFTNYQDYRDTFYQPGIRQPYGSSAWLATASRSDTSLGTTSVAAPTGELIVSPTRRYLGGDITYVSGSHNLKFGISDSFGGQTFAYSYNADLGQIYQNGVPVSVSIHNSPVTYRDNVDADAGIYGQDSWTFKRLTVNYGARFEYFKTSIPEESNGAGRFVGVRDYPGESLPALKTFSPRFGIAYDVFGNGKTALKVGANKFQQASTYGIVNLYNPVGNLSATATWKDNGDNIAQGAPGCVFNTAGCEINFAQVAATFGQAAAGCSIIATAGSIPCGTNQVDPNLKRIYNVQYNLGIQHELLPRVAVTANWFHTSYGNLKVRTNVLQSASDFTPVQVVSPMDGSLITVYNISAAKVSAVRNVDTTGPGQSMTDNSIEFGVNARLPGGLTLFAGTSTEKLIVVACDNPSNPNSLLYCNQESAGIPWNTSAKGGATIPLKFGIQLSATLQSSRYVIGAPGLGQGATYSGTSGGSGPVWVVTPTTKYSAGCLGPCTPGALVIPGMTTASMSIPLQSPALIFSDRINQLDVNLSKSITVGKFRFQPELAAFNILNVSPVITVRSQNFATASYLQPASILPPRILRVGLTAKW